MKKSDRKMQNRRQFLAGAGLSAMSFASGGCASASALWLRHDESGGGTMSGFVAPKLKRIRVGVVGVGSRGTYALKRLAFMPGVEIAAFCDIQEAAMKGCRDFLAQKKLRPAREFFGRLGPVVQYMNINRGDRFDYLNSMETKSIADFIREGDPRWNGENLETFKKYLIGGYNSSLIRTANGKIIFLNLSCAVPHPYSRINTIQGTHGIFMDYPLRIDVEDEPGSGPHGVHDPDWHDCFNRKRTAALGIVTIDLAKMDFSNVGAAGPQQTISQSLEG